MPWPRNWDEFYSGSGCPKCAEGRPAETAHGIRVRAGDVSDAYLAKRSPQRGYVVVIWRGRHVVDPIDLEPSR
jgi:hypothetical protein